MQRRSRQPKLHQSDTIHHVMMRGNNRQDLFYGIDYFEKFLSITTDSLKKFDHAILAYCLMTNHVHFIIHVHEATLSDIMQNINYRYACWTNRKLKRIGHLFQARYRSIAVQDEEYLINLCRYIHFNPITANMVQTLADYPWSSHHTYQLEIKHDWISTAKIKQAIKHKTGLEYSNFIHTTPQRDQWQAAMYVNEKGEILINDELLKNAGEIPKCQPSPNLTEETVTEVVCKHLKINTACLYMVNSTHQISKKRALLIYYLNQYTNLRMSHISMKFKRKQPTLTRQVAKIACTIHQVFPITLIEEIEHELENLLQDNLD